MSSRVATPGHREPNDIRCIRTLLQRWPFTRGRGIILRMFDHRIRRRDFLIEIASDVFVRAELDDFMVMHHFAYGFAYEPPIRLSLDLIRPGDVLLDVGANIGLWTMSAARRTGTAGRVYAFEPVPRVFQRLTDHVRLNNLEQVQCTQVALSERCGRASFFATKANNSGLGSLARRHEEDELIQVELSTLDEFCKANNVGNVSLIKVDVEGAESSVFSGGGKLLSEPTSPAILVEVSERQAVNFGSSGRAVKELLTAHGYGLYEHSGRSLEPVAMDAIHVCDDLWAFKPFHFEKYPLLQALVKRA